MSLPYRDRTDAGRQLALKLARLRGNPDVLVLALPRGGVPVGFEVAESLEAPLDVFLVRKIGVPGREELALGAIASGGIRVLNPSVIAMTGISEEVLDALIEREQREMERRERAYRAGRGPVQIEDRVIVLVDDGLATGATMLAAARAIRNLAPRELVVAVPVASGEACELIEPEVDEIICAETPWPFRAVGLWYEDFSQTTDEEVRELLTRSAHEHANSGPYRE